MPPGRLLIDSSVWIEYYRTGGPEQIRKAVRRALSEDTVVTTSLVVTEVVQGAKTESAYSLLWEDMTALPWLEINRAVVQQAARWGFSLQRQGSTVPATDLLIAAVAVEYSCRLWHLDAHFERVASLAPLVAERPE